MSVLGFKLEALNPNTMKWKQTRGYEKCEGAMKARQVRLIINVFTVLLGVILMSSIYRVVRRLIYIVQTVPNCLPNHAEYKIRESL
jgi:hypothetical protein